MASLSDETFELILNMIQEELMDQVFEKEIQETENEVNILFFLHSYFLVTYL